MKFFLAFLLLSLFAPAAEPLPLLTTSGKVLLSEDFSGSEIPKSFRTLDSTASFSMADGALQVASRPGQARATHGVFMIQAHDLTVAFTAKFAAPGALYVGVDGYKAQFNGNTHLVRFSLTPEQMAWDEHRGGPESKHNYGEAAKAARAAKQPIPKPTAEQLADPTVFHIQPLASRTITCAVREWHRVLLEVCGHELVAQVDGQTLAATDLEADSAKNRIGIGLTGRTTVLIKDVRISENQPRPDWQRVRATLTPEK